MTTLAPALLLTTGVLLALILVWWRRSYFSLTIGAVAVGGSVLVGTLWHGLSSDFGSFSLATFAIPGFLLGYAAFAAGSTVLLWQPKRRMALLIGTLTLTLAALGVDAFWVEPKWLEVTHTEISSPKITEPLRIALLADIQFDDFGEYETSALEQTMAQEPDLIVFAGDYIHAPPNNYDEQFAKYRQALKAVNLSAPLGVYAVQGDVDDGDWTKIYDGLNITAPATDLTIHVEGISLTMLNLQSSANAQAVVPDQDGLHIVLGHRPDFALGDIDAELLLAGHIHGGQVRIPFYGPPITFSQVPRNWSSGRTKTRPGQDLYVSRGIGMERGNAPRVRFLTRPELAIIDLIPEPAK